MPASPLVHRTVTAVAVTLGVGALAASASGMRTVDAELAAATKAPVVDQPRPASSVVDGDPVKPVCDEKDDKDEKVRTTTDEREL